MARRPASTVWSGQFGTDCADFKFVNGAVAGGAGANAKQVLASRLPQSTTRRTRSRRTPAPS